MKVQFRSSFLKDIKTIQDKSVKKRLIEAINSVETAQTLQEISNIKKLRGPQNYYRIRIGDYRAAFTCEGEIITFVRFLHRREIYRYLP